MCMTSECLPRKIVKLLLHEKSHGDTVHEHETDCAIIGLVIYSESEAKFKKKSNRDPDIKDININDLVQIEIQNENHSSVKRRT